MDSTKTISALISWGEFYKAQEVSSPKSCPRLRINNNSLEVQHALTFWEKICDRILSFFGVGDRSLHRVMMVAREVLLAADPLFLQQKQKALDSVVKLLNEKADHYNSRKFLGIFPLPRSNILKLSVPQKRDPQHCGIKNEGNTCFAAATLQALFPLHPKINLASLRSFYESLSTEEAPKSGIQKLLKTLLNDSWRYQKGEEGDPAAFLEEALIPHMKQEFQWTKKGKGGAEPALLHQVIKNLHEGSSTQEIVHGNYLKQPLVFSSPPKHFAVSLIGRKGADESYIPKQAEELVFTFAEHAIFDPEKTAPIGNSGPVFSGSKIACSASTKSQFFNLFGYTTLPVKIDDRVDLSVDGEKKAAYRLASVVMYANHHYYTLVPEYTAQGAIGSWIEYNDSVVSKVSNSVELRKRMETNGYLVFYDSNKGENYEC